MTSAKRDIFIGLLLLVGGIFLGGGNEQIFGWWGGGPWKIYSAVSRAILKPVYWFGIPNLDSKLSKL